MSERSEAYQRGHERSAIAAPRPEPERGALSVPQVEPVAARVRIEFAGLTLAESGGALRVSGAAGPPIYYLPRRDVRTIRLEPSGRKTRCDSKGTAAYWSVRVGGRHAQDAAWSYADPGKGYEAIRGYIAFDLARVDACWIGSQRARPTASSRS